MAEDIKSLTKKNADLERRLMVAEAKIKALADNMTSPGDIQKFMKVVSGNQSDFEKRGQRLRELAQKESDAYRKTRDKERQKEWGKQDKEFARHSEMARIDAHLKRLEAMVLTALKKP